MPLNTLHWVVALIATWVARGAMWVKRYNRNQTATSKVADVGAATYTPAVEPQDSLHASGSSIEAMSLAIRGRGLSMTLACGHLCSHLPSRSG